MNNELAKKVVNKMLDGDEFSRWLDIEPILIEKGHCILKMKIRKEMVNGFGIAHGGITFSFADSALAFASNAHGRLSVALECSISFAIAVNVNDELTCEARELSLTNKTATYHIEISNQKKEKVAFFKGTVYRTSKEWFPKSTDNESVQMYGNTKSTDNTNNESIQIHRNTKSTNNTDEKIDDKLIYPELSYLIIGCAYDVFNQIGGGHKESVYQKALRESFSQKKIKFKEQVFYQVKYGEKTVGKNFFDFLIDEKIVVELKSLTKFSKANFEQTLNYLHTSKLKLGLLLNFNSKQVDVKRVVNFDLIKK